MLLAVARASVTASSKALNLFQKGHKMTDASLPLTPVKQELFVQELMRGTPQAQAYEKAGYKPNPGNASELASSEKVSKRLAWLQQRQAARKGITVESLCDELDEACAAALVDKQYG